MSKKVCSECGAVIGKPKKHLRWHYANRPIPGPQGPAGPQGMAGQSGDGGDSSLSHSPIDTIIAMLREQARK